MSDEILLWDMYRRLEEFVATLSRAVLILQEKVSALEEGR